MVPEPEKFKATWEIESAIKAYFDPMLETIQDVVDVSVKSQILYLSTLSLKPQAKEGAYFVTQDDLGKFLYF